MPSKKAPKSPKKTQIKKIEPKKVELSNIDVKEKVSQGWIHVNSMIEIMGVKKEVVEESLKQHLAKIDAENGIIITKKSYSTVEKVPNPPKNIPEAYSQFVEIEALVRNYSMLIYYVFTYGPAALEVLEPKSITLGQGEAQDIANALAALIHQFAANAGGVVISRKGQQS